LIENFGFDNAGFGLSSDVLLTRVYATPILRISASIYFELQRRELFILNLDILLSIRRMIWSEMTNFPLRLITE